MKLRSAFVLALLFATATAAHAEPTAAGFWEAKDDDGNTTAWFLFSERNNVFSARLVKGFRKPGDTKPVETICAKCPGQKKGAHIMGLTLFWGMKRDGLQYREGSVLDPRDGSIYHALMNLSENGKELEVRGYVGISALGKSQTWLRLPDDAMKKEDIPKEILAGGPVAPTEAVGDKPKPRKGKDKDKAKPEVTEPEAPAADKPAQ